MTRQPPYKAEDMRLASLESADSKIREQIQAAAPHLGAGDIDSHVANIRGRLSRDFIANPSLLSPSVIAPFVDKALLETDADKVKRLEALAANESIHGAGTARRALKEMGAGGQPILSGGGHVGRGEGGGNDRSSIKYNGIDRDSTAGSGGSGPNANINYYTSQFKGMGFDNNAIHAFAYTGLNKGAYEQLRREGLDKPQIVQGAKDAKGLHLAEPGAVGDAAHLRKIDPKNTDKHMSELQRHRQEMLRLKKSQETEESLRKKGDEESVRKADEMRRRREEEHKREKDRIEKYGKEKVPAAGRQHFESLVGRVDRSVLGIKNEQDRKAYQENVDKAAKGQDTPEARKQREEIMKRNGASAAQIKQQQSNAQRLAKQAKSTVAANTQAGAKEQQAKQGEESVLQRVARLKAEAAKNQEPQKPETPKPKQVAAASPN